MAGRDFVGGRPDAQGSRNTPVPLGLTSRFSVACFVVAVTLPALHIPTNTSPAVGREPRQGKTTDLKCFPCHLSP